MVQRMVNGRLVVHQVTINDQDLALMAKGKVNPYAMLYNLVVDTAPMAWSREAMNVELVHTTTSLNHRLKDYHTKYYRKVRHKTKQQAKLLAGYDAKLYAPENVQVANFIVEPNTVYVTSSAKVY